MLGGRFRRAAEAIFGLGAKRALALPLTQVMRALNIARAKCNCRSGKQAPVLRLSVSERLRLRSGASSKVVSVRQRRNSRATPPPLAVYLALNAMRPKDLNLFSV